uniref:hypothetical protein n=1 Tax=Siminovitchia fortis TaxID=254758 RepID=UPI001C92D1DE
WGVMEKMGLRGVDILDEWEIKDLEGDEDDREILFEFEGGKSHERFFRKGKGGRVYLWNLYEGRGC